MFNILFKKFAPYWILDNILEYNISLVQVLRLLFALVAVEKILHTGPYPDFGIVWVCG